MIPFSVLDLAPILEGGDGAEALRNSLDLARHAERWATGASGWPSTTTCRASPAPRRRSSSATSPAAPRASASAPAASCCPTTRRWSSPSSSARSNRSIPGRIDLGLGRAPGTDPRTALALRRDTRRRRRHLSARRRRSCWRTSRPPRPGRRCAPSPATASTCRSGCSARASSAPSSPPHSGCPSRSHRTSRRTTCMQALDLYRGPFTPFEPRCDRPYVMVGVNVFAADTDAEARRLFTSVQQAFLNLRRGVPSQLPPPVDDIWMAVVADREGRRRARAPLLFCGLAPDGRAGPAGVPGGDPARRAHHHGARPRPGRAPAIAGAGRRGQGSSRRPARAVVARVSVSVSGPEGGSMERQRLTGLLLEKVSHFLRAARASGEPRRPGG